MTRSAPAAETPGGDDEGPAGDQDATQRLEPVGNAANNKARSASPGAAKDDKGQP